MSSLFCPLELPSGTILKNRLIKSAMSDTLGDGFGDPTPEQMRLYETWGRGGVAASIIGEVQADPHTIEHPGNLILDLQSDIEAFRMLAKRSQADGAALWLQLGHSGALAPDWIGTPKGPSALDLDGLQCEALSESEISVLPDRFARTARLAHECGFGGVQINAAHGFLLSQFLSPLFNQRRDIYGGSSKNRMRLVIEVVEAVRAAVPNDFTVSIKLNATDQIQGGLKPDDAFEIVAELNSRGLDLIEVSGGTYFPGGVSSSDIGSTGPYFIDFARAARAATTVPVMATGGFKTREQADYALESGAVDCIGLARALVLDPALPNTWMSTDCDPTYPHFEQTVPGGVTAWYTERIHAIATRAGSSLSVSPQEALDDLARRSSVQKASLSKRFEKSTRPSTLKDDL